MDIEIGDFQFFDDVRLLSVGKYAYEYPSRFCNPRYTVVELASVLDDYEPIIIDHDTGCAPEAFEAAYTAEDGDALAAALDELGVTCYDLETPTGQFRILDPVYPGTFVPVAGGWLFITGDSYEAIDGYQEGVDVSDFNLVSDRDGEGIHVPVDGGWIRITGEPAEAIREHEPDWIDAD